MQNFRKPRAKFGLGLLLLALAGWVGLNLPPAVEIQTLRVQPLEALSWWADGCELEVTVNWTPRVLLGQLAAMRLTAQVTGEAMEPGVLLEVRLDWPGAEVQPGGAVRQVLATAPIGLNWQVKPQDAGASDGTLWVYLLRGEERVTLLGRQVNLRTGTVAGLGTGVLQWLCGLAAVLGTGLIMWRGKLTI